MSHLVGTLVTFYFTDNTRESIPVTQGMSEVRGYLDEVLGPEGFEPFVRLEYAGESREVWVNTSDLRTVETEPYSLADVSKTTEKTGVIRTPVAGGLNT